MNCDGRVCHWICEVECIGEGEEVDGGQRSEFHSYRMEVGLLGASIGCSDDTTDVAQRASLQVLCLLIPQ